MEEIGFSEIYAQKVGRSRGHPPSAWLNGTSEELCRNLPQLFVRWLTSTPEPWNFAWGYWHLGLASTQRWYRCQQVCKKEKSYGRNNTENTSHQETTHVTTQNNPSFCAESFPLFFRVRIQYIVIYIYIMLFFSFFCELSYYTLLLCRRVVSTTSMLFRSSP